LNIAQILKKMFIFDSSLTDQHSFELSNNADIKTNFPEVPIFNLPDINVSNNLQTNIDYLKTRYNVLINSDIILREFYIKAFNKKYKALLLCIDGMIDSELINNYILKPLMSLSTKKITKSNSNQIKKIPKQNLENYLYNNLIPQNSIKKINKFSQILQEVNSGSCAVFVESLEISYIVDVKGFESRSVSPPKNEIVVRGAQEAFTEKLRTNTSMLRRYVNNENLIIEDTNVGKISSTKVSICYMQNITNDSLVSEVKYRINNLNIDYIISSGQLEQLIQDNSQNAFPQIIATERPDKASNYLLEGRVVILVNGSPYSLIVPGVFFDFLSSPEDLNLRHQYSNLLKFVRIFATLITLLLPGIYIALTTYHTELIPTELLFTIAASRNSVPFPVLVEILLMEISFELIREAGLRIPTPIGPTIGIIGALVLGEAAVSANLVSPILIIIVALTGICSFSIPDFSLSFSFRIYKFLYILLGAISGLLGISVGLFIQIAFLANQKSFGAPYLAPYVPTTNLARSEGYFQKPIWNKEKRLDFLDTKRPQLESDYSMLWKFWKKLKGENNGYNTKNK